MRTFIISDIHGQFEALKQCFQRSGFEREQDRLICLGDVCDRGGQTKECIDILIGLKHCVYLLGNHDAWALQWGRGHLFSPDWLGQGGWQTMKSYDFKGMPKEHVDFLKNAKRWLVEDNCLFVHAGFDEQANLEDTPKDTFIWDRSLVLKARQLHQTQPDYHFGGYKAVYIGHTPTIKFGFSEPQRWCNVWEIDTGAGFSGKLTIMDISNHQFWQSDPVK